MGACQITRVGNFATPTPTATFSTPVAKVPTRDHAFGPLNPTEARAVCKRAFRRIIVVVNFFEELKGRVPN